jgi:hypothetical protein
MTTHVLRLLVQGSSQLHWLFNTEMPPLPLLLWQRFPEALVLFAIGVAAWLAGRAAACARYGDRATAASQCARTRHRGCAVHVAATPRGLVVDSRARCC